MMLRMMMIALLSIVVYTVLLLTSASASAFVVVAPRGAVNVRFIESSDRGYPPTRDVGGGGGGGAMTTVTKTSSSSHHCRLHLVSSSSQQQNIVDDDNDHEQQSTISSSSSREKRSNIRPNNLLRSIAVAATMFTAVCTLGMSQPPATAVAAETSSSPRIVGSISGSGLFFKDTLEIEAFDDPKVRGVKLYISNFQIPLAERLSTKNFFNDPSYASVACTRTGGPIAIADTIAKGPGGEEVFEESKSLLFKTLRVQRIYDEASNTIIYVSFNTRIDKNEDANKSRFKSSICAIGLD